MNRIYRLLSTGFYTGYSPFIPGTVGTLPAFAISLVIGIVYSSDQFQLNLVMGAAAFVTFFISVWAATGAEDIFGHDSKKIVIDEWAGMFVALLFIPFSLLNYVFAFLAFRLLDAIKIFPASKAEKLPKGWGVTMDDMVAGLQANIATWGFIFFFRWLF
jgi:phosphatidylglycerophosphatase A